MSEGLTLSSESIEAIASRLAETLNAAPERLLSASELAGRLGVSREYVYEHTDELGVIRIGDGPKAHLRFDFEETRRLLRSCTTSRRPEAPRSPVAKPRTTPRRSARSGTSSNLLPVKGTPSDRFRSGEGSGME